MSIGVDAQAWIATYTFFDNHVKQVGALNALASCPEWLVARAEYLVLVLLNVLVPVSIS